MVLARPRLLPLEVRGGWKRKSAISMCRGSKQLYTRRLEKSVALMGYEGRRKPNENHVMSFYIMIVLQSNNSLKLH